jgi:hypothetical protein
MTRRFVRLLLGASTALGLAACGGGGGHTSSSLIGTTPSGAGTHGSAAATVAVTLTLGDARGTSSSSRTPQNVISGFMNGVRVVVGPHAGWPAGATTTIFDVSRTTGTVAAGTSPTTSQPCVSNGSGNARTCTLFIPAPVGNPSDGTTAGIDFFFTTYDAVCPGTPPYIPVVRGLVSQCTHTATLLSIASLQQQTIAAGAQNTLPNGGGTINLEPVPNIATLGTSTIAINAPYVAVNPQFNSAKANQSPLSFPGNIASAISLGVTLYDDYSWWTGCTPLQSCGEQLFNASLATIDPSTGDEYTATAMLPGYVYATASDATLVTGNGTSHLTYGTGSSCPASQLDNASTHNTALDYNLGVNFVTLKSVLICYDGQASVGYWGFIQLYNPQLYSAAYYYPFTSMADQLVTVLFVTPSATSLAQSQNATLTADEVAFNGAAPTFSVVNGTYPAGCSPYIQTLSQTAVGSAQSSPVNDYQAQFTVTESSSPPGPCSIGISDGGTTVNTLFTPAQTGGSVTISIPSSKARKT